MNMKDYEERVKELKAEAEELQASMNTMNRLSHCHERGHDWDCAVLPDETYINEPERVGLLDSNRVYGVSLTCSHCLSFVRIVPDEQAQVVVDTDPRRSGDLAGRLMGDISFDEPLSETTETDEIPDEQEPVDQEQMPGGAYKVDGWALLGVNKEEEEDE